MSLRSENLKLIIDHYGVDNQLRKLNEEIFELIEAIHKLDNGKSMEDVVEEFSDCMVLLMQIKEHYGISNMEINEWFDYKVDRQLKRIEVDK